MAFIPGAGYKLQCKRCSKHDDRSAVNLSTYFILVMSVLPNKNILSNQRHNSNIVVVISASRFYM